MSVAKHLFALGFVAALVPALAAEAADKRQIVSTYGDIAQAMYQDALTGAEALKRFTGSDAFGASYTQTVPLRVEPGLGAAVGMVLSWETFTEAALEAGESRLYGGIHFYEGNVAGLDLGRKVGAQAFELAQRYWDGRL